MSRHPDLEAILQARYDLENCEPAEKTRRHAHLESLIDRALVKEGKGISHQALIQILADAYQEFKRLFSGPRWEKLHAKGAKAQRLLWASTGTKNKEYSDVLYVEELIGPDTVNTVPPATLDAFRDHAASPDLSLSWFDATVLTQRAREQAQASAAEQARSRLPARGMSGPSWSESSRRATAAARSNSTR